MDTTSLPVGLLGVCAAFFGVACFMCVKLMARRSYLLLLLWPLGIYFYGPAITCALSGVPVLGKYVFVRSIVPETLMMFTYVAALYGAERLLNLSGAMRASLESQSIKRLARSSIFLPVFIPTVVLAVLLQFVLLHNYGSILSGVYLWQIAEAGQIPYWGFIAGLYEIIFMFIVLYLLSEQDSTAIRIFVVGAYVLAAALRVAGGTRLVLVKEIAVILIIAYAQGRIRAGRLAMAAVVVVVIGSIVGLARAKGHGAFAFLGPLYGLVMESGLNALTFNVAYNVQASGFVVDHGQLLNTLQYVVLSAIPKFLRFGIGETELAALSPYNTAIAYGFHTAAPVGGMSGFATISYISSYPFVATFCVALAIAICIKYVPNGPIKSIALLAFAINAIHFWRDPVDIAVKDVVQDFLCAAVLLYVPALRRRIVTHEVALAGRRN